MDRGPEVYKAIITCGALAKSGLSSVSTPSATLLACLACVIGNFKSFHSFLFKLCIMIVHILKMCLSILCTFYDLFLIFEKNLKTFFPTEMLRGCPVCVICNSNSIHSFLFKLCIMIVHTLKISTTYLVHL